MPSLVSKTLTAVHRQEWYVAFIILVVPCAKRFGAVQNTYQQEIENWVAVRISLDKLVDVSDFVSSRGW